MYSVTSFTRLSGLFILNDLYSTTVLTKKKKRNDSTCNFPLHMLTINNVSLTIFNYLKNNEMEMIIVFPPKGEQNKVYIFHCYISTVNCNPM